jgi:hypothetical protein
MERRKAARPAAGSSPRRPRKYARLGNARNFHAPNPSRPTTLPVAIHHAQLLEDAAQQGLGRHAWHNGARPPGKHALIVYTYNEAASIAGVARRTLQSDRARPRPAIIELSSRRGFSGVVARRRTHPSIFTPNP